MDFNIPTESSPKQTSDAINYLLANVGGITTNPLTGAIIGGNKTIAYLYKYIHVKYATDTNGTGFSNSPVNATYYGIYNSDSSTESTDPSKYLWIASAFGTTNSLFYKLTGGRGIVFQMAPTLVAPTGGFIIDRGAAIDLDAITSLNEFFNSAVGFTGYAGAAVSTFGEEVNYGFFNLTSGKLLITTNGYATITSTFAANRRIQVDQQIKFTTSGGAVSINPCSATYSFFTGGPYNLIVPFGMSLYFNVAIKSTINIKLNYAVTVIDGNTNGAGPYNEMTAIVPNMYGAAVEFNI